ncbi:MAG: SDR family NAD(P)-dependent oxidoreductase [Rhodospirillales bacterium]
MKIGADTPAVITGGASGLGAAAARALAESGAPVALFDVDSAKGEAEAAEMGGNCAFVRVDMTDPKSVAAGLQAARARFGQERILVNCAGIAPAERTVSKNGPHDPALFARVIAVNLTGAFNTASQSAAGMAGAGPLGPDDERGVIINTASIAAFEGQVGQIAYAASKAGVAGMTLPMARDLSRFGVRVMAVAPGVFKTPMLAGLPDEIQDSLAAAVPFPPRLGDPAEFARLVRHIIENPMLNGEVIRLDGAQRLQPK